MTDYQDNYHMEGDAGVYDQGGYMHNPASNYAAPTESPKKGGGGGSGAPKNHSLLPLTIRQLHLAQSSGIPEDATLRIDGHEVNEITFIGQIMSSLPAQANNVIFVLEDGTGQIDVKVWFDTEKTDHYYNAHSHEFVTGAYVRVTGSLKTFHNKKNVQAFRLTLIRDPNEITFHFLEAIYVHLYNRMGGAQPMHTNVGAGYHSNATTQLMNSGSSTSTYGGMSNSSLQEAIINLARVAPETGISFAEICQKLPRNAPDEIKKEIDSLFYDGALYTTLDDEHYKAT